MFLAASEATNESPGGAQTTTTDNKLEAEVAKEGEKLRTMDKVVIASVVVAGIGVLVQIWALSRQIKKEREVEA